MNAEIRAAESQSDMNNSPAPVDGDPQNALLPEDREWLTAHGWIGLGDELVTVPELNAAMWVIRFASPDEREAYWRDVQCPPFTLLAHALRDPQRRRLFRSVRRAVHVLGALPPAAVTRLAATAARVNPEVARGMVER